MNRSTELARVRDEIAKGEVVLKKLEVATLGILQRIIELREREAELTGNTRPCVLIKGDFENKHADDDGSTPKGA